MVIFSVHLLCIYHVFIVSLLWSYRFLFAS